MPARSAPPSTCVLWHVYPPTHTLHTKTDKQIKCNLKRKKEREVQKETDKGAPQRT